MEERGRSREGWRKSPEKGREEPEKEGVVIRQRRSSCLQ